MFDRVFLWFFFLKAILYATFGSETFVKAFQLRAKCFIKLSQYEHAFFDIEISGKYDDDKKIAEHHNRLMERILLKAICLFSLNRFKQLKDYFRSLSNLLDDMDKNFDETKILAELNLSHLTLSYLRNFINDPNFANQTNKPTDSVTNPGVLHFMESLVTHKQNYIKDPRCTIQHDDHKGRHFVAKDLIPKGTIILVERSYSLTLDIASQFEYCLYCLKRCSAFIPCRNCVEVVFCSENCLQHAWNRFHRNECTLINLFKDSFNVSLHMYRAISITGGFKTVLLVQEEMENRFNQFYEHLMQQQAEQKQQQQDQELFKKQLEQCAKNLLKDEIINDYISDYSLRDSPSFQQTDQQLIQIYRMSQVLLDHNELYEDYYDVCYMGVSMDVALLLMLWQFMITSNEGEDNKQIGWHHLKELIKSVEPITNIDYNCHLMSHLLLLNNTVDEYIRLIVIIQMNIRKLITNVFSWNNYDDNCCVTKTVATCQCLIGSLINHSCNPNVEWDFRNGCIIYTALR